MTNKHSRSFFGQSTGITLQSSSKKDDYIFLKCIKKKSDGNWEKPSQGEGKTIKISLEEMIMIVKVFKKEITSWSTYHSYKDQSTQISFNWQNNGQGKIWINIGEYSKMLDVPQIELFKLLLDHLIKEKVEFATISSFNQDIEERSSTQKSYKKGNGTSSNKNRKGSLKVVEVRESNVSAPNNGAKSKKKKIPNGKYQSSQSNTPEVIQIEGKIKRETPKALLIELDQEKELWFPKSTIRSDFNSNEESTQNFSVDSWVVEKNLTN